MSSTPSGASRGRRSLSEQRPRPGLIGIDQEARMRLLLPHDAHQVDVTLGVELQLEQFVTAGLARLAARIRLIAESDREAGGHGRQGRKTG